MSNHTMFPDAIVFPDGTIRLVTRAAKNLVYSNTNIGVVFSLSTAEAVPDYLAFDDTIPQMFEDDGMTVKWERQPVGHYRGKKRAPLKTRTSNSSEDAYDGHRAKFEGLMKAAAEKRKKSDLPEEKRDEI